MQKYNTITPELLKELKDIPGLRVVTDPGIIEPYGHDETPDSQYNHMPEAVVFAETAQQVAAILKLANQYLVPVVPRGAGTGLACGAVPIYGGIVLSLEKMNKILEVNADSMYMVVEPGARTDEVQKAAGSVNLFYAGDPCSGDSCFIGGNAATNAGGNKAVKYGTTRQQVYSLEVVTPTGEIATFGGRVEKNTTGYSLEQLMIGSEGTLGIITKITLKLKPLPKNIIDLLAVFPDVESAIGIVSKIQHAGITPTCVEFMDTITIQSVERYLREKLPNSDTGNYIIVQVEAGSEDEIDDKCVMLDELCTQNGALTVLVADSAKIWRARKSFAEALRAESLTVAKEDIVVPVDKIAEAMHEIANLREKYTLETRTASHAGDGNIHLNILKQDTPDAEWADKIEKFQQDLYTMVYRLGGKLSGEHGIGYKRRHLMEQYADPVELAVMRAIKKAMDPKLILNPGKIFNME
jgi:FAD/FMN-containing dehydrogenases